MHPAAPARNPHTWKKNNPIQPHRFHIRKRYLASLQLLSEDKGQSQPHPLSSKEPCRKTSKTLLKTGAALTDAALERLLPHADTPPHSIHRAMRHSTFAGGKRLRPILCIEAARMVSGDNSLDPVAAELGAAIEMIHTYSLIHDDLPALDNDDLRRGQPTCHVVFGEAAAILAGDALQTLAFQTVANLDALPASVVAILRELSAAIATGVGADFPGSLPPGMIGGQVMDIESEGVKPTAELVERIHRAKTGALITVSVVAGAHLAGATPEALARVRTFGQNAGLAFQIVDDVLDMTQDSAQLGKTAGKDTASDKATWPAVFGIDESIHAANELIADAFAALEPFGESRSPAQSSRHLSHYAHQLAHARNHPSHRQLLARCRRQKTKVAAVALGGLWTWWNYRKSRIYATKLDPAIDWKSSNSRRYYIDIVASVKNAGAAAGAGRINQQCPLLDHSSHDRYRVAQNSLARRFRRTGVEHNLYTASKI